MNNLENFNPYKTNTFLYKTPEWINKSIISLLQIGSKFAKMYYSNPSEYNKEAFIRLFK